MSDEFAASMGDPLTTVIDPEPMVPEPVEPEVVSIDAIVPESLVPIPAEPAPNVILEYRDSPGSEHVSVFLEVMDHGPYGRPHTIHYNGRAFVQSRIGSGGLWVYATE